SAGFYSITSMEEARAILRWEAQTKSYKRRNHDFGSCLVIPFPDAQGKPSGYKRLKPDRPRIRKGDPVKYESPRQESNHIYFPPGIAAVLGDISKVLLITEGEKKALKATQEGFPCLGLVGVYGWVKKRPKGLDGRKVGPKELLSELEAIPWQGRTV